MIISCNYLDNDAQVQEKDMKEVLKKIKDYYLDSLVAEPDLQKRLTKVNAELQKRFTTGDSEEMNQSESKREKLACMQKRFTMADCRQDEQKQVEEERLTKAD